jgi:hypothetical protein
MHFNFKLDSSQWLGTFDNSISNAVIIDLMLEGALPNSVLISFTGGEERPKCIGAVETFNYLSKLDISPEMFITLDVTNLGYKNESFTIENYYARKNADKANCHFERSLPASGGQAQSRNHKNLLQFKDNKDFISRLKSIFHHGVLTKEKGWNDESYVYAKKGDVNCFSFCLPSASYKTLFNWMHSRKGILLKDKAVAEYSKSLKKLVVNLSKDINKPIS